VTAPLTPHDDTPQLPQFPGADDEPFAKGGPSLAETVWPEIFRGPLIAVLVTACGVVLGLLWAWLAPRVPLISDGQGVYLKDTEGEEAIGGDGTFTLIAAGLGVLTAAGVFWRWRRGGIGPVLGLAAGGVLASIVGWKLGVSLGPDTNIVAHAMKVGPQKVFDAPLELRAKSALVAWSVAAMLAHLLLTSAFGPRDEEQPYKAAAWPPPGALPRFPGGTPPLPGSPPSVPLPDRPDGTPAASGQERAAEPGEQPDEGPGEAANEGPDAGPDDRPDAGPEAEGPGRDGKPEGGA
jgi:hypothetical protein